MDMWIWFRTRFTKPQVRSRTTSVMQIPAGDMIYFRDGNQLKLCFQETGEVEKTYSAARKYCRCCLYRRRQKKYDLLLSATLTEPWNL